MRKFSFPAVFEPGADGYGVYFPDLPGCVSFGKTFEKAQKEAEDALGLHIYGMEKDGEEIPLPSERPEKKMNLPSGAIVSLITVYPDIVANELDNRRVKTNVTLPAWLKEAAEKENVNYSRVLEAALIDVIRTRKKATTIKANADIAN